MKCLVLILWFGCLAAQNARYVTYDFSHGRFGDNLISYLHAKWYAHQEGIPLIYKPFPHSAALVLHDQEMRYEQLPVEGRLRALLGSGRSNRLPLNTSIVYICPYFPENRAEWNDPRYTFKFDVDWKNVEFRAQARAMLAPRKPLECVKPPEGTTSIAIHVREGGGYDVPTAHLEDPLKFPPLSFYQACLAQALEQIRGQPVYCHVFTDALHPEPIVNALQDAVKHTGSITFDWRKQNNGPHTHILEDFFSLFEFDILIRPQSNFSIVPSLLKDYLLVYSPVAFSIAGSVVTIDQIQVERN